MDYISLIILLSSSFIFSLIFKNIDENISKKTGIRNIVGYSVNGVHIPKNDKLEFDMKVIGIN